MADSDVPQTMLFPPELIEKLPDQIKKDIPPELLENLKHGKGAIIVSSTTLHQALIHSGQTIPAFELEALYRIDPQFAERTLHMAEVTLKGNLATQQRSQWLPFIQNMAGMAAALSVIAMMLFTAYKAAELGHPTLAGIIMGGVGISSVIGAVFHHLWGRERQHASNAQPAAGRAAAAKKPALKRKR